MSKINTFVPNYCSHPRQNRVGEEWICLDCGAEMDPLDPNRVLSSILEPFLDGPWGEESV